MVKPVEKVKDLAEQKRDGWENTITALGTARDKSEAAFFRKVPPVMTRDRYEDLFTGDDMAATLVELPSKEMVRQWITFKVDDAAKDERGGDMEEENATQVAVMQQLDDLNAKQRIYEAEVWARVFGGSLLFLGVDDGAESLSEPLQEDAIRSFNFLSVFDRFDVMRIEYDLDMQSPTYGQPTHYLIQDLPEGGAGAAKPKRIHASRFVRFDGVMTTKRRKANNGGWADPVYIRLEKILRDFGIAWKSVGNLIQDFAQAVFKMRGLADAIASDDEGLVLSRVQAMDLCRSVARAIPLDAEDEDFMRQQTPIAGLPELMDRFAIRLSSAARMPVTLLMGMSPAGLNATGESDIVFFYDQIKAMQEAKLREPINRLIELIFASADGPAEPGAWSFEFNPLWQMSDKESAEIRKLQAETDSIYLDRSVLSENEVAESRFGGDVYSTETNLDREMRDGEPELEAATGVENVQD